MIAIHDPSEIRPLLHRDPIWAVYALGDLDPQMLPACEWLRSGDGVTLLMRGFDTPILWSSSTPVELRDLLATLREPKLLIQIRPELLPVVAERYQITRNLAMLRMELDPAAFRPVRTGNARRLRFTDQQALYTLFDDGVSRGESPDFFYPEMVETGVFYGAEDADGKLAAVAGTHLVSYGEKAAAIGNVYTRRDSRGQGLARLTTSRVVEHLLEAGVRTVALNVKEKNGAAIHAYETLGFKVHCPFIEGTAEAATGPGC